MSRLESCFAALKAQKKKALVPFLTAGDPNLDVTLELAHSVVDAGADIIEFGVPFSDPMADGPVIQRASERALVNDVSLTDVCNLVKRFRETDNKTPIVLMGYVNPIEVLGYAAFAKIASEAGVDAVLTVDLPPEEAQDFLVEINRYSLDAIFLIAPTTSAKRIELICEVASGFLYYVSFKGVTGAAKLDTDSVKGKLSEIRKISKLPIAVGFGIKDASSAASISQVADAVVVGSALVQRVEQHLDKRVTMIEEVRGLLASMRTAMDVR
jgi:tryptophan synthase alpha chain